MSAGLKDSRGDWDNGFPRDVSDVHVMSVSGCWRLLNQLEGEGRITEGDADSLRAFINFWLGQADARQYQRDMDARPDFKGYPDKEKA